MSADIYGFVFIRSGKDNIEKLIDEIKNCQFHEFSRVEHWNNSDFCLTTDYNKSDGDVACWLPESDESEQLFDGEINNILAEFSKKFNETIALYIIDDYYHYQHWKNGELIRLLDGNDNGIEYALGKEEEWENKCFNPEPDSSRDYFILVDEMYKEIKRHYNLSSDLSEKTVYFSR